MAYGNAYLFIAPTFVLLAIFLTMQSYLLYTILY